MKGLKFTWTVLIWLGAIIISCQNQTDKTVDLEKESGSISTQLQLDPLTGLVVDENLHLIKANCLACHSSQMIIQNRLTKQDWLKSIRWMQETQNLWDLGQNETPILEYLAKNYAPEARFRRKPLGEVDWYMLDEGQLLQF